MPEPAELLSHRLITKPAEYCELVTLIRAAVAAGRLAAGGAGGRIAHAKVSAAPSRRPR